MNQDVLDFIAERNAHNGGLFIPNKLASVAAPIGLYEPEVDTSAVSATYTITSINPDRSEDVVEPRGLDLTNYRRNPVVLFDHGPNSPGGTNPYVKPIGKSKGPDGKLTVKIKDGSVDATCFFSQKSWEAMQFFELVDEGILNAASVYCLPIEAGIRTAKSGRRGLHITAWDMPEWSICGVGDNPDAVRKVLDRGKLAGRPIAEPLLKSLQVWAPQLKTQVQGMSVDELEARAKAAPPFKKKDDEDAPEKGEGEKPPGDKKPKDAPPEANDEGDDPEAPQDGDDAETPGSPPQANGEQPGQPPVQGQQPPVDASQKPGAQLLSGMNQAITGFASQLQSQVAAQENSAVIAYVSNAVEVLNGLAVECQEAHRAAYGSDMQNGQQQQMQQPGAMPGEDQQFIKSLSLNHGSRLSVKGLEVRFKRLADNAELPTDVRDQLRQSANVLGGLVLKAMQKPAEATAETEPAIPPEVIKAREALSEHRKTLGTLLEEVKSLRPLAMC